METSGWAQFSFGVNGSCVDSHGCVCVFGKLLLLDRLWLCIRQQVGRVEIEEEETTLDRLNTLKVYCQSK